MFQFNHSEHATAILMCVAQSVLCTVRFECRSKQQRRILVYAARPVWTAGARQLSQILRKVSEFILKYDFLCMAIFSSLFVVEFSLLTYSFDTKVKFLRYDLCMVSSVQQYASSFPVLSSVFSFGRVILAAAAVNELLSVLDKVDQHDFDRAPEIPGSLATLFDGIFAKVKVRFCYIYQSDCVHT